MTQPGQRVIDLRMTCSACPTQWEGTLDDGRCVYVRYRWGCLTWGFGDTPYAAIDDSISGERCKQLGGEFDGELDEMTMLDETGMRLAGGL